MDVYAIGDLHGRIDRLTALLNRLPANAKLVFLGDYLDKGPDPRGVIDRVMAERHRAVFLLGNHEFAWLRHLDGEDRSAFLSTHGGPVTLRGYGGPADFSDRRALAAMFGDHLAFLRELQPWVIAGNAVCVHGGIDPAFAGDDLSLHDVERLVFLRFHRTARKAAWQGRMIVCGHDILGPLPSRQDGTIVIDTGAWQPEGRLTALELNSFAYVQDDGTCGRFDP